MSVEMKSRFEVMPTASRAWSLVSGVKLPFILASMICGAIQLIINIIQNILIVMTGEATGVLLGIILMVLLLMPAYVGLMFMGLQRVRGLPVLVSQIFTFYRMDKLVQIWLFYLIVYAVVFVLMLLMGVLSTVPVLNMVLLIAFPLLLIFLAARFSLGIYFIFDKNKNALDSLKTSYAITNGNVINIFLSILLMVLSIIIGFITIMIGLIWAVPFSYIFFAMIYETLTNQRTATI